MSTPDLVALARSRDLDSLTSVWQQAATPPVDVEEMCRTLEVLCEGDMAAKALELGSAMVESLASSEPDHAVEIGHTLVELGAHSDGLLQQMHKLLEERHTSDGWYGMFKERAGMSDDSLATERFLELMSLYSYRPGQVVNHTAGWGVGEIQAIRASDQEVTVKFVDGGRSQDFPLDTILDTFKRLSARDLRAMKIREMDELQRLAKEEPQSLIRKGARLYRGRINSTEIKRELSPDVIPTSKWNSFWKRAKEAANTDPWLQIEGTRTRPVFILRKQPVSLVDEVRKSVSHTTNVGDSMAVVRDYLARTEVESERTALLDISGEVIEKGLADPEANKAHLLDGLLLLEDHDRHQSVSAAEELKALITGEDGILTPEKLDELATQEAREHAIRLLPAALGEKWVDRVLNQLLDFPVSVTEQVVDMLVEGKHAARLLELWERIAPYPRRHPMLLYLFGKHFADGTFDGLEGKPELIQVGRVLLHLLRVLCEDKRGNTVFHRLVTRTTSLLAGRRKLICTIMEDIGRDDLSSYLGITERGGPEFPREVTSEVLKVVADRYPDITARPEKPFWEEDFVYVTSAGLKRQKAEYDLLVGEKIPENSKAIGAAASLGDLSENSEWESAMEEQRNLTGRATEMDEQLRVAKLIEDQEIPDGVVAPGTKVTLSEPDGGQRELLVLGPWDVTEDNIINYLAPMAQRMLGKKPGDELELPGGDLVKIESITRVEI